MLLKPFPRLPGTDTTRKRSNNKPRLGAGAGIVCRRLGLGVSGCGVVVTVYFVAATLIHSLFRE
jgi:hypothetical protein